jgi:hypothetical protein
MRKLRDIKYASGESQGVKDQLIQNLSERRGKLLLFKAVVPIAMIAAILYSIVALDGYLFENPELKEKLEADAVAYESDLMNMVKNNPWGNSNVKEPKYYIMSFFTDMDSDKKRDFMAVLETLSPDKINFLMQLLTKIELSDAQKVQLLKVFETLLNGDRAGQKISTLVDLVKSVSDKAKLAKAKDLMKVSALESVNGEEELNAELNGEELLQSQINEIANTDFITKILTLENPDSLDYLLDEIIKLSGATYTKLISVLGSITTKNGEILIDVMEQLKENDTRNIVKLLSNLDPKINDKFLSNVIAKIQLSQIPLVVNAGLKISSELQEQFIGAVSNFSKINSILLLSRFVNKQSPKTVNQFVGVIQGKVSVKLYESLINTLDGLDSEIADIVNIMSQKKFTSAVIDKGDRLLGRTLKTSNAKEAVRILTKLGTSTIQKELIEEADELNRDNANKAVEVYKEIKVKSVEQSVQVSKTVNVKSKNLMISQLHRLKEYKVKIPSAVVGVRGKPKQIGEINNITRTSYNRIDRIERVIGKVHAINQSDVTESMVATSKDIKDENLRKAGDIFLDLDITSDKQRAARLMSTYRRLNLQRREDAIETLDDIGVGHVSAAVDIAHKAGSKLLNQSVDYATGLKKRLGEEKGLLATMRVINIASRVKTNKDRQDGLDQLRKEREARVARILIQTDGHNDIFDEFGIKTITKLYKDLDEKYPKQSILHRTPASKLADALSGSNGIVLGTLASAGGRSRRITQDTKLFRMGQYLSNDPEEISKLERRANFMVQRPIIVPHEVIDDLPIVEDNFDITYPDIID